MKIVFAGTPQFAVAPFGAKFYPTALLTGGETAIVRLRKERNLEL